MSRKTLFALAFVAVVALAAPETANGQLLRRGGRGRSGGCPTTSGCATVSSCAMPVSGCGMATSGMVLAGGAYTTQQPGTVIVMGGQTTTQPGSIIVQVTGTYDIKPGTKVEVSGLGKEPVQGVVLGPSGTPGAMPGTVIAGQMPYGPVYGTQTGMPVQYYDNVQTTTSGRFFRRGGTTRTTRLFQGRR